MKPLTPDCLDAQGVVRRCRGCPHVGHSKIPGCDRAHAAALAPALAAFDRELAELRAEPETVEELVNP